jgi:hypothetical protein
MAQRNSPGVGLAVRGSVRFNPMRSNISQDVTEPSGMMLSPTTRPWGTTRML